MAYSIFISSVFEDSTYIKNLKDWANRGLLGDGVVITHETEVDIRSQGDDIIRRQISKMIEGSSAVLFLVGKDTHNHDWIRIEVELAKYFRKKIIVARIQDTDGGVPNLLNSYSIIPFHPFSIKKVLFS